MYEFVPWPGDTVLNTQLNFILSQSIELYATAFINSEILELVT